VLGSARQVDPRVDPARVLRIVLEGDAGSETGVGGKLSRSMIIASDQGRNRAEGKPA
jgi:hypothetical protein